MKQALLLPLFGLIILDGFGQNTLTYQVFFNLDQHNIESDEETKLAEWTAQFNSDSIMKLEIIGHTDELGSNEYNLQLSENRGNAIIDWFETNRPFFYKTSIVDAKGEEFASKARSSTGVPSDRKVEIFITLESSDSTRTDGQKLADAEIGESIVFENLKFIGGQHFLLPQAYPELEQLIDIMLHNPSLEIEIQGHVCCRKDTAKDGYDVHTRTYDLSWNRAKHIRDKLVYAGVEKDRISHIGFGGLKPLISPEITNEDRMKNRRVEIKVTGK